MPEYVLATLPESHRKGRDALRKRWQHYVTESSPVWAVRYFGEPVAISWADDRLVVVEPGFPRMEYGLVFAELTAVAATKARVRITSSIGNNYDFDTESPEDATELARRVEARMPKAPQEVESPTQKATELVSLATTEYVPGFEIVAYHGDVLGVSVRARDMFANFGASLRTIVGGEARGYTSMLIETRNEARERLAADAVQKGANAVIGMRFTSTEIADLMSEIAAYGTAVTIRPIADAPS